MSTMASNSTEHGLPSERSFGLLFALVFGGLGVYTQYKSGYRSGTMVLYISSFLLLLIALLVPKILTPFNKAWFWLGQTMGKIVNPVVLGIIFFFLLTPIALIGKLFGRDALRLKKRHADSYWLERDPVGPAPDSFRRQF